MTNKTITKLPYSQFHKTLPKSSLQLHWISVRLYEMGDSLASARDLVRFFFSYLEGDSHQVCTVEKLMLFGLQCPYRLQVYMTQVVAASKVTSVFFPPFPSF